MSVPVLAVAEMRAWEDATWAEGVRPEDVVRRVGGRIAAAIAARTAPGDRVVVVAGKGRNGDDARACAAALAGRTVDLIDVSDPGPAIGRLRAATAAPAALVLDGLFGIGLDRPLEGAWADLVASLDAGAAPVIALDVPSGLDADSGRPMPVAPRSEETWTLGAPKAGLLVPAAAPHVGRLRLLGDIGLRGSPVARGPLLWTGPEDFLGLPPRRPVAAHKGTFGHAVVLAGSDGYHGAAVLATRGALRARPGLVTLIAQSEVLAVVAAQLSAPMVRAWSVSVKPPENATAFLAGPGLAARGLPPAVRDLVLRQWREFPGPMVVDATAIDWLPQRPSGSEEARVITPHPGEAARILHSTPESVQRDRPGTLREISRRYGNAWIVLKGHQTLVGRSEGPILVNPSGNPGLSQGGTGDVLAGFMAGLLAQAIMVEDVARTLSYAVWRHGGAADELEAAGANWTSEELAGRIGT